MLWMFTSLFSDLKVCKVHCKMLDGNFTQTMGIFNYLSGPPAGSDLEKPPVKSIRQMYKL